MNPIPESVGQRFFGGGLAGLVGAPDILLPGTDLGPPLSGRGREGLAVLLGDSARRRGVRIMPVFQVEAQLIAGVEILRPFLDGSGIKVRRPRHFVHVLAIDVDPTGSRHVVDHPGQQLIFHVADRSRLENGLDALPHGVDAVPVRAVASVDLPGNERLHVKLDDVALFQAEVGVGFRAGEDGRE